MRAVVAVVVCLTSGCSFIFAGGPPAEHQLMPYFDCPSTSGLPVADAVVGLSSGLATIVAVGASPSPYESSDDRSARHTTTAMASVIAAVFLGSAIYGVIQTSRCDTAKQLLRLRIERQSIHCENARVCPPAAPAPVFAPPLPAPVPTPPATPPSPEATPAAPAP